MVFQRFTTSWAFFFCQASTKFCFSVLNHTWHTGNWFHESNKHDTKPLLLRFGSVGLETRSTSQVQTCLNFDVFEGVFQICYCKWRLEYVHVYIYIYNIRIQVCVKMRIISYQITKILYRLSLVKFKTSNLYQHLPVRVPSLNPKAWLPLTPFFWTIWHPNWKVPGIHVYYGCFQK